MSGIEEILQNQTLGVRIKNLVLPPVRLHDDALKKLGKNGKGKWHESIWNGGRSADEPGRDESDLYGAFTGISG